MFGIRRETYADGVEELLTAIGEVCHPWEALRPVAEPPLDGCNGRNAAVGVIALHFVFRPRPEHQRLSMCCIHDTFQKAASSVQ